MIENFSDKLYQLESEHVKDVKIKASIILKLEGKKCSKTNYNVPEKQYEKSNNF